ncbi:hypothetical protein [Streptomyces sp. DG1A-41]
MTTVFDRGVLPLGAPDPAAEPNRVPPLLLAGEDEEEALAADPHIVRSID